MGSRITQLKGRSGFYVEVHKPLWLRQLKGGGNSVVRKAGATKAEAKRNAIRIEAELQQQWDLIQEQLEEKHPLKVATSVAATSGIDLDDAVEELMREAGIARETREAVLIALKVGNDRQLQQDLENQKQDGLKVAELDQKTQALVDGLNSGVETWQQWLKVRRIEERTITAKTASNWESTLKGLAEWLGSDHVGAMSREQAHQYKLHLMDTKGLSDNSVKTYVSVFSGFWNWSIRSGKLQTENIWTGLKKGLSTASNRKPLEPETLAKAEAKADRLEDIRWWFGRYQGLRKSEYCGLRWSDIDLTDNVIHLKQYTWNKQVRTLKGKEKDERTIPLHSKLRDQSQVQLVPVLVSYLD